MQVYMHLSHSAENVRPYLDRTGANELSSDAESLLERIAPPALIDALADNPSSSTGLWLPLLPTSELLPAALLLETDPEYPCMLASAPKRMPTSC